MIFKPVVWFRIAVGVVAINIAGGVYAYLMSEPVHAFVHGALAVGFGLWASHLRPSSRPSERQLDGPDKVEMLEANVSELETRLRETQERLDFADQLLKNKPPPR